MTIIRRSAAAAGLVLAILGLAACLAGTAGTWAVKARVQGAAAAVFGAADGALEFIATRLGGVRALVDASRPKVNGLAGLAQRLQAIELEPDLKAALDSLREHLDGVATEMTAAEGALDPIEAVARGVESAATAFGGTSIRAADVAEFAREVAVAVKRLEALRARLLEIRERRLLARELAAVVLAEVADLDTRFANLSRRIDEAGARVAAARVATADKGRRVQAWITLGALVLTGTLLWFAASQVCVLRHTWAASRL